MADVTVWAFDVDGTLIGSIRSEVLRPGAVDLLAELNRRGVRCVLWSAGGDEYALRVAQRHGIEHHFSAFYAKTERDSFARYAVAHFAEVDRPSVFVDDVPVDLPIGAAVVAVQQFMGNNPFDAALATVLAHLVAES
jgi:phosphoglycolate phosphatase-like HAD superfamily hydrolase